MPAGVVRGTFRQPRRATSVECDPTCICTCQALLIAVPAPWRPRARVRPASARPRHLPAPLRLTKKTEHGAVAGLVRGGPRATCTAAAVTPADAAALPTMKVSPWNLCA